MGAESVRDLLDAMDLEATAEELRDVIANGKGQKRAKAIKRLKVVDAFRKSSGNKPDWYDPGRRSRSSRRTCAPWCSWTAAASRPPT